jgi:DNA-binding FrmR family transcriptional regulator
MRTSTLDKHNHLTRLRKIEGQVRGLQRLVDEDTPCIDILTQIAAVDAALRKVAIGLVDQHLRRCVLDAVTTNADDGQLHLTEATIAVDRLLHI